MSSAILLSIISLLVTILTGNVISGFTAIPLFFITVKFAKDELKAIVGEGASDLFTSGFIFPLLVVVNQHFIVVIAVFLFVLIWILTIKAFLPNWVISKQRLFTIGMLVAILSVLQFSLFIAVLPILLVALYRVRNSIKKIFSLITGFAWMLLGIVFTYPTLAFNDIVLQSNTIVLDDLGLQYFLYAISIVTLLWAFNIYWMRRKWRPENRYLIYNIVTFALVNVAMIKFDPLPAIVVSLPILHMAWNLQVKKSNWTIAFALSIIILLWLNQQYVINYLNLQY